LPIIWAIAANAERDGGFSEISTSQGLPQNFTRTPDFRVAGVAEIFVQTAQDLFIIFHRGCSLLAELTEQKKRIAELEAALSEKSRSLAECLDLADSGDKIYAIYHQAESSNFGVYELVSGKIRTVCADAFVVSRAGRYSKDRCTYYRRAAAVSPLTLTKLQ